MGAEALSKHTTATHLAVGTAKRERASMWNLRHVSVVTTTATGTPALHVTAATSAISATRVAPMRRRRPVLRTALVLIALLTVLPFACAAYTLTAPSVGLLPRLSVMNSQQCPQGTGECDDDGATPIGPFHGGDTGLPALDAPPCEQLCERIQRTYHDARTQALLVALAQTPTGQGAVTYLLTMADRLGEGFITWRDMGQVGSAGLNTAGGYIQLNSALLTRRDLGNPAYFLSGTLLHESIESYFDIAEGIRDMGTRHADYVAQWFNGKFERELHALPYYTANDPWYLPSENNSYRLTYAAWLKTEDGQLYRGNPATPDLRHVDRRGRAWAPSDWWAEQGGYWMLGQGVDVTPIPNSLGLSPAMLVASDLSVLAQ
jgi:hypothetical protein